MDALLILQRHATLISVLVSEIGTRRLTAPYRTILPVVGLRAWHLTGHDWTPAINADVVLLEEAGGCHRVSGCLVKARRHPCRIITDKGYLRGRLLLKEILVGGLPALGTVMRG